REAGVCWEKPREGWLKCNVNAGFFAQNGVSTTANCFRDHMGQFRVATTSWQQPCLSTVEGEALAILSAMRVAIDNGF
ncbi:cytochrome p450, partial [Trifolium pratense]